MYYSIHIKIILLVEGFQDLTRLGDDRVMPNSVRINLGLDLRGPDIRPGLENRHLIIEVHRGLRR